jgi:NAD-dependent deacetylase
LKIVVLTGAGMSAESGIKTFRDHDGLWENHRIEDVATPEAWRENPELVTQFYNQRRVQLETVKPNDGHYALKELEQKHEVVVITQNVDDLHERAGSSSIIHLHGELCKMRNEKHEVFDIGYQSINYGEKCPNGMLLRPHIVWFGEDVPLISKAAEITKTADMLVIIGTSLEVYPAAGLINEVNISTEIVLINPQKSNISTPYKNKFVQIFGTSAKKLPLFVKKLIYKKD